jgi:hypothetical protein
MIKLEKKLRTVKKKPYSISVRIEIEKRGAIFKQGTPKVIEELDWKIIYHPDEITNVFPHSKEIYIGNTGDSVFEFVIDRSFDLIEMTEGLEIVINKFNYLNGTE